MLEKLCSGNNVVCYEPKHYNDLCGVIEEFSRIYLAGHCISATKDSLLDTINNTVSNTPENVFIAESKDKCVGVLAGVEVINRTNNKRVFQEILWYTKDGHNILGFRLVKEAEMVLQKRGYDIIIMSVMESSKSERIKDVYKSIGYKPLETHFVKVF